MTKCKWKNSTRSLQNIFSGNGSAVVKVSCNKTKTSSAKTSSLETKTNTKTQKWDIKQEAQLSPSDRAMRLVSSNLANYHLPRNSAETTYTTSPDQTDGMKLEV